MYGCDSWTVKKAEHRRIDAFELWCWRRFLGVPWTVAYQAPPPWDFPGKSAGVDCHFLFQGIFPTQESNPGLPHCRQTLYLLSHQDLDVTYVNIKNLVPGISEK